jgi:hypothetical protein
VNAHFGRRLVLFVLASVGLPSSCARVDENPLAGEWNVMLVPYDTETTSADRPFSGKMVFDAAILCYCAEEPQRPMRSINGRGYLSLSSVGVPGSALTVQFDSQRDGDMMEEIVGRVGADSTVVIQTVGMSGINVTGLLSGDTIRGTWEIHDHGRRKDSGRSVLVRVPATAATDSAITRSRREVTRWRKFGLPPAEGPADTVSVVEPI